MGTKTIQVLDPTGEVESVSKEVAKRQEGLDNKRLGLLDNNKPNGNLFLERVKELLASRFALAETVWGKKPFPTEAAPTSMIDHLTSRCDGVINAVGD